MIENKSISEQFNPTKMPEEYKWYVLIDRYVKELNMQPKDVYKMNYIDSLNWLSMWNARDKIIENKNK